MSKKIKINFESLMSQKGAIENFANNSVDTVLKKFLSMNSLSVGGNFNYINDTLNSVVDNIKNVTLKEYFDYLTKLIEKFDNYIAEEKELNS